MQYHHRILFSLFVFSSFLSLPSAGVAVEFTCIPVKQIHIHGATTLSASYLLQQIVSYQGPCVSLEDIKQMQVILTKAYMDKGYTLAKVRLSDASLITGVLQFIVEEGKVEAIRLNDSPNRRKLLQTRMAFPTGPGKVFNSKDISQGLEQMNRLHSNHAQVQLAQGKGNAATVKVTNALTNPIRGYITYDNFGHTRQGEHRGTVKLEDDNLLSLNDSWNLSHQRSIGRHSNDKQQHASQIGLSIPYGYYLFSSQYSYSTYQNTVPHIYRSFMASGNYVTSHTSLERVIFRNEQHKTTLGTHLTFKNSRSYLEDHAVEVGSRKLAIAGVSLSHAYRTLGSSTLGKVSFDHGLHALGAVKDRAIISHHIPTAQFKRIQADLSHTHPFTLLSKSFSYRGNLHRQYSSDHLYSSEQITLGDPYTIRGFKEHALGGDSGVYMHSDLGYPITLSTFGSGSLEPYVGFDMGMAHMRGGREKGYTSSSSVGLRYQHTRFTADLTYAYGLKTPAALPRHPYEVYFTINLKAF